MVSVKFFLAATLALLPSTALTSPVPADIDPKICQLVVTLGLKALPEDQRNFLIKSANIAAALAPGLEMDGIELLGIWACSQVKEECKDPQSAGLCFSMNNLSCYGSVGDQSCQAQASGDCNEQYC